MDGRWMGLKECTMLFNLQLANKLDSMRRFLLFLFCLVSQLAVAQKFGYIDSKFILGKMPEYKQASSELGESVTKMAKGN